MHTNAKPTDRRRTLVRASATLGFVALAAGGIPFASGQAPVRREPAARLLPPKPIESTDSPIISRGLEPDLRTFDPTRPVGPTVTPRETRPTGWSSAPAATAVRPAPRTAFQPRSNLTARLPAAPTVEPKPSLLDRTWSGVKDFFGATSTSLPALPAPGIVPHSPYTFVPPMAPRPTAAPTQVYAGPPAYRWYGWGTTTPGANPYAPNGQHPRGSANWFAQTGATPGAFPVPVSGGALAFGASPPSYTGLPGPADTYSWPADRSILPVYVTPRVSVQPPTMSASPMIGIPTIAPQPTLPVGTAMPVLTVPAGSPVPLSVAPVGGVIGTDGPTWQRSGEVPPVAPPAVPSLPVTPSAPVDTNWGPAKGVAPVIRGQGPSDSEPVSLEGLIRAASSHRGTVTEVKQLGSFKLLVKLTAANESEARLAADAIARVRQLQPYAIQFEVRFGGR